MTTVYQFFAFLPRPSLGFVQISCAKLVLRHFVKSPIPFGLRALQTRGLRALQTEGRRALQSLRFAKDKKKEHCTLRHWKGFAIQRTG